MNNLQPSIGNTVSISNKTCSTFDVSVTGKKDLVNPSFTLSKSGPYSPIQNNSTGVFTAVPYGEYCVYVTDQCGQFIQPVCFSVGQPLPKVPETIVPSYVNCSNFGLELHADSVHNPTYCLYDKDNKEIECNTTGIFNNIPLGSYCVTIHDECRDTTIKRCFLVGPPQAVNDMNIAVENQTCSTFTAHVYTSRLAGNTFSLYDADDKFLFDNTTGIFDNLPYSKYCVKTKPTCPDTTLISCITVARPVPSIGNTVNISDKTCTTFTATVTNMTNLTNPEFFLADADGNQLGVNNLTGIFENLAYGDYCILVKDGCFDTDLKVCFSAAPDPFKLTVQISASCDFGSTKLNISLSDYPGWVYVYNPSDVLVFSRLINSPQVVDSLPNLPDGQQYKVQAVSGCSVSDITLVSPVVSWFRHSADITQRCPGSIWPDGSGNINATGITNTGNPTVRVIKKDGVLYPVPLQPNLVKFDTLFIFQDLGPGNYIVQYTTNDACKNVYYDTVTIKPYDFPNLDRSTAFQCDVNGFSVGAVVSDGIGPFTYEIISSNPATPSILAGPQENPVFTINNGYNYSLIRLRALDACGNATLGDASVLPLVLSGIKVSENCIGLKSVLTVDEIFNGNVKWYYQKNKTDKDSTYLGDGYELDYDPLVEEKTGYYYATIEMNNGCVTRAYEYHLTGNCSFPLAQMQVEFTGRSEDGKSVLNWSIRNGTDLKDIYVERKNGDSYETIGKVSYSDYTFSGQYRYVDQIPLKENYYRLKIMAGNGKITYSKIIHLGSELTGAIKIYPNPAKDIVTVRFNDVDRYPKMLELISMSGQTLLREGDITNIQYQIHRNHSMPSGVYILKVTDQVTGTTTNLRIVFK